ncbi:TPA: cytochrome c biogenesis protein DipZ [Kluyvera georgiana]|nr:cytochrome c biogenesis protein DipZ [Kluyvera georgiana]HED1418635.1 cytochrome c biogenesis protein DipZ [Kluyvera georgiana]
MTVIIAFLGGMLTLLSPCTLPVIPFLFASMKGQKRHLAALLGGMVLMFTALSLLVTVASAWVTQISAAGRWLALAFLTVVALSLISPQIAQRLASPAVRLGNQVNDRSLRRQGVLSALLAGIATGLLWAPCAGPVLGAILSLEVVQGNTVSSGVLLAAYGGGCAVMLALLWLGGQRVMRWLRARTTVVELLKRLGGVAMLASVILIASGTTSVFQGANTLSLRLEQHLVSWVPATPVKLQPVADSALPQLTGGTGWINSAPLSRETLKGKVVLVDFWTFDCINCQHTLPHVREWAEKYRPQGLEVIGVHTPEYPHEKNLAAVTAAVKKWRLSYPVVTDNNYQIWRAFGNQYWPAHYLFDARGQLRYTFFGEGNYSEQEQAIAQLLKETRT